jgi:hypothetical protein
MTCSASVAGCFSDVLSCRGCRKAKVLVLCHGATSAALVAFSMDVAESCSAGLSHGQAVSWFVTASCGHVEFWTRFGSDVKHPSMLAVQFSNRCVWFSMC